MAEPVVAEPVVVGPVVAAPVTAEPVVAEPSVADCRTRSGLLDVAAFARVALLFAALALSALAVGACDSGREDTVSDGPANGGQASDSLASDGQASGSQASEGQVSEEQASEDQASEGQASGDQEVIVYASVDQNHSEPVLDAFEAETGIRVRAVYDVEAAKTTGLVNRLLAEQGNPIADVWWSGEFAQTIELADKDVLAPYRSPVAEAIPSGYSDPDGLWTGFGGRARVLLVNTDELAPDQYPDSVFDLLGTDVDPSRIGMAHPVFGTTATHAAALYAVLGSEDAKAFFEELRDNGIKILDGNAQVRDQVADGQLAFGITDTDDACGALARGAPVEIVFPDQEEGAMGTLIVPNTVALVDGGPNEDAGQELVDYLLSEETARSLLESGWIQTTLRPIEGTTGCVDTTNVRAPFVGLREIAGRIEQAKSEMADVFVR